MVTLSKTLEIVLTGRNDGYGGEDFVDRMCTAADFNHRHLTAAGVAHTYTFVEWNPIAGRPLLAETLRKRLPWFETCYVASNDWHGQISTNPRLQFMEFFAKNVGIRRSRARWVLTTNSDIFLSPEVIARLADGSLEPGTLYRAVRIDIDRTIPWRDPNWEMFRDTAKQLRRHHLQPPYFSNAAGDFLLLDRETYHRLGGFNEIVRFAKIYKDGQFCIQAQAHGLPIESLGDIYHLDHDGSFATATAKYGPKHEEAPFGPWWDAHHSYVNRGDWGLTAATEEADAQRSVVWLRSPDESGPTLSVIVNGAADATALRSSVTSLLASTTSLEVLIADASGPTAGVVSELWSDSRVRLIDGRGVTGLNEGLARARGRLLCVLPTPSFWSQADLSTLLQRFDREPALDAVMCTADGAMAPVAIFRRTVYQALGEVDARAPLPLHAYWHAAPSSLRVESAGDVTLRTVPSDASAPNAWLFNLALERGWSGLGTRATGAAPIPAGLFRDHRRRSGVMSAAIEQRLTHALPANTSEISLYGVDLLTFGTIEAARRLGVRVLAIYTSDATLAGDSFAGIPIVSAEQLPADAAQPIVLTTSSPVEEAALRVHPAGHHLVELIERSVDLRDDHGRSTLPTHLAEARLLREGGHQEQAFAAYQMLTAWADDPAVLRERAELAAATGRLPLSVKLYRRLLARRPADATMLRYRIASLLKQLGRLDRAASWFERVLQASSLEGFLEGGSHFHLGDLAEQRGDIAGAERHFREALRAMPHHQKAKERIDGLRHAA